MSDLTAEAMEWLATHHNVIVTPMLRACGVSRTTCDRLVRAGVLRNPLKGVFALASAPLTLEHRCAVLCAGHPGGFITGPTAGALEGLRRMPRSSALHYAVRHGTHLLDEPGVHFRQTTKLLASHYRRRADGIVIATPVDWLSTSVLICRRSITYRSCTSCSIRGVSRWSSSEPSATSCAIRPDRVAPDFDRHSLGYATRHLANRTPRSSLPRSCAGAVCPSNISRVLFGSVDDWPALISPFPTFAGVSSSTSIPSIGRSMVMLAMRVGTATSTGWRGKSSQSPSPT